MSFSSWNLCSRISASLSSAMSLLLSCSCCPGLFVDSGLLKLPNEKLACRAKLSGVLVVLVSVPSVASVASAASVPSFPSVLSGAGDSACCSCSALCSCSADGEKALESVGVVTRSSPLAAASVALSVLLPIALSILLSIAFSLSLAGAGSDVRVASTAEAMLKWKSSAASGVS